MHNYPSVGLLIEVVMELCPSGFNFSTYITLLRTLSQEEAVEVALDPAGSRRSSTKKHWGTLSQHNFDRCLPRAEDNH